MNIRNFFFIALAVSAGCGGDDTTGGNGSGTTPTASGVFPAQAFQGKALRIEVTGDATTWTSAATVSFGAGVTVNSVALASPTDLIADVTIAGSAATGLNDVIVTDGSDTFTLTKAFEIDSPFKFATTGTLAQGSVLSYTVTSLDFNSQFDTTSTSDPVTGATTFTNLAVNATGGVRMTVDAATTFSVSGTMLVDVDAVGGAATLDSGPTGTAETFDLPKIDVAKRTATPLVAGTPATGMITAPLQTDLYTFNTGASAGVATITPSTTSTTATVGVIVLPASGHFADLLSFSPSFTKLDLTVNDTLYAIYFDNSGATGYSYTMNASTLPVTVSTESASNDTAATAQALAVLPAAIGDSSLSSDTDVDFYKITVTAADIGKHIHVVTGDGGTQTDTLVDIFGPNVATTAFDESSDNNFGEDLDSKAIVAAGTYFIEVSLSTFNGATSGNYTLLVQLD